MKIQKLFFLLSVALLLAGCGKKEGRTGMEETGVGTEAAEVAGEAFEETEETEGTEESIVPEERAETIVAETASSVKKEEEGETEAQTVAKRETGKQEPAGRGSNMPEPDRPKEKREPEESAQTEPVRTETPPPTRPAVPETAEHRPEAEPQPEIQPEPKPQPASYSPGRVAELATAKTKAYGKVYIPDDLDRMLSEGTITEEDYQACYPTDGAGYLEYYVASDLNEARDLSGTVRFGSEEDIAANIAGMYSALPQQYFYIEYHGTATYGGKECYVFYCYRA